MAKITKQPFKTISQTAKKPFERIHLDLIGPIKPESSLKHRFILTIVDNHSGYLAGFPLVHKDDTTNILIQLLTMEKERQGYFPSTICSDGGGEFVGSQLVKFLNENNIQRLISEPYHPEHNSRAERANRTIFESICETLNSSQIQKRFWHEVLKSSCLALNQIPRKDQDQSPWSIVHSSSFPENLLKPIGTPAIILKMNQKKVWKFEPEGEEEWLVGFNSDHTAW
jgi:transposase InsO family protein